MFSFDMSSFCDPRLVTTREVLQIRTILYLKPLIIIVVYIVMRGLRKQTAIFHSRDNKLLNGDVVDNDLYLPISG